MTITTEARNDYEARVSAITEAAVSQVAESAPVHQDAAVTAATNAMRTFASEIRPLAAERCIGQDLWCQMQDAHLRGRILAVGKKAFIVAQ